MEFDLISDIHFDEINNFKIGAFEKSGNSKMLVIAGDVAKVSGKNLNWEKLVAFVTYCCTKYDLVIYVPGNHEYYTGEIQTESMATVFLKLKSLEGVLSNLKVLDNESYIMKKEGIVIFGATLWSEVPRLAFPSNIPMYMLDEISGTNINITHAKWMEMHYKARASLEDAIKVSKHLGYKLVIVTHYAPVFNEALNPKHHGDSKNAMYCTDLSHYFPFVDVWAFGHTGWNCDYMVGKTRIVSNQYIVSEGKPYEKKSIAVK